jgi:hypothetical protein
MGAGFVDGLSVTTVAVGTSEFDRLLEVRVVLACVAVDAASAFCQYMAIGLTCNSKSRILSACFILNTSYGIGVNRDSFKWSLCLNFVQ